MTPSMGEKCPAKFRKKVPVEAIQWTGDNLREVIDFTGWHPSASSKWTWEEYEAVVKRDGLKIFTLEGPLMVAVGDWILKGSKGECWPVRADIFAETYESESLARATAQARIEEAVRPWREALRDVVTQIDDESTGDGRNPYPRHCHERRGVWDRDNRVDANQPCKTCAAFDNARALLHEAGEGKNANG